ncbi:hypothetical protein AB2N08_02910 [Massilia aurea]|uniref:hypothetical protein n=1 Tax=Massilia aurea TaxID=373040 RepID=UPI00346276AE
MRRSTAGSPATGSARQASSTASPSGASTMRAALTKPNASGTPWTSSVAGVAFVMPSRVMPGGSRPCDGRSSTVMAMSNRSAAWPGSPGTGAYRHEYASQ